MKKNNSLVCFFLLSFEVRNVSFKSAEKEVNTKKGEIRPINWFFWHKVSRQAVTAYYAFF